MMNQPQDAAEPGQQGPQEDDGDGDDDDRKRQASLSAVAYTGPDPHGFRWFTGSLGPDEPLPSPYHSHCGSQHYPDQRCGNGHAHVASVAIGFTMDLDKAGGVIACERMGIREGLGAVQAARGNPKALAEHHNRFLAAWKATDQTMEDTAILHGFQAVVRPVLAGGSRQQEAPASRLDFPRAAEAASVPGANRPETVRYLQSQGASSLPTQHQVTDPNNTPTPQDDQFDPAAMFPIDPAFAAQWVTGPGGAQPTGGQKEGAARHHPANPDGEKKCPACNSNDLHFGKNKAWCRHCGATSPRSDLTTAGSRVVTPKQASGTCKNCSHPAHEGQCSDKDCQCTYAGRHLIHDGARRTADIMTRPHQTTGDFAPRTRGPPTRRAAISSRASARARKTPGLASGRRSWTTARVSPRTSPGTPRDTQEPRRTVSASPASPTCPGRLEATQARP